MAMQLVAVNGSQQESVPLPVSLARLVEQKNEVLVDALPYIDKEYEEPNIRDLVDNMVEEEMNQFEPEDYISSLPPIPPLSLPADSLLRQEWERVAADPDSNIAPLDLSRYEVGPPQGKDAADPSKWQEALIKAQNQLEYTAIRTTNADLLAQYGVNSWRAYNSAMDDSIVLHKAELEKRRVQVVEVNRKRMAEQLTVETKIRRLEERYQLQVQKNMRLEALCMQMEKAQGGGEQATA